MVQDNPSSKPQQFAAPVKVVVTEDSIAILKGLQSRPQEAVKFVAAREGNEVIVALGWANLFHVQIIEHSTQELWGKSIVTSVRPDQAAPMPGVIIHGGRVRVDWGSKTVSVYGRSDTFGDPGEGIFEEPTVVAVRKIIEEEILKNP